MQIANYVTPNIFSIVQKSSPDPAGGAYSAPPDPLAALGWDGDFKTLYPPRQEILGTRLIPFRFCIVIIRFICLDFCFRVFLLILVSNVFF